MVDELYHFYKEVLLLRGALFAFGVEFDDFVDTFVELFLLFSELLTFLLVLGLSLTYGRPVFGEQLDYVLSCVGAYELP